MHVKYYYDKNHASIFMKVDEWAFLRLHKNYKISITVRLNKKYAQQYVDSFQIIERIERLVYRFDISNNWRVHNVFIVAQLKFCSSFDNDSYRRSRSIESNSMSIEKDIDQIKSWKLNRLIDKRRSAREIEYLIRWKNWNSQHDVWKSLSKFDNAMNLIKQYEVDLIDKVFSINRQQIDVVDSIRNSVIIISLTSSSISQFSSKQRFAVVISRKFWADFASISSSSISLTFDIDVLIVIRKSFADFIFAFLTFVIDAFVFAIVIIDFRRFENLTKKC